MCLINTQNKAFCQCRCIEIRIGLAGVEGTRDALHGLTHDRTTGTSYTGTANLFMIKQSDERYVLVGLQTRSIDMLDQTTESQEAAGKIIKSGRVQEL